MDVRPRRQSWISRSRQCSARLRGSFERVPAAGRQVDAGPAGYLLALDDGRIPTLGVERKATMKRPIGAALGCGLLLLSGLPAAAQSTPNTAMNAPDQVAWQIFIQVNTRAGGSNATFETWASDTDTFQPN